MKQLIFFILVAFFLVGLYFNFFFTPDTAVFQANDAAQSGSETSDDVDEDEVDDVEDEDEEVEVEDEAEDEIEENELSEDPVSALDDEEEDVDEEGEEDAVEDTAYDTAFSNEELNALYQEKVDNDETLNINLSVPAYYNAEELIDRLEEAFDDEHINFEYSNLEASSLNLTSIFVDEDVDVVMFNAMQVTDFDIQILHNRTLTNIQQVYQDLVNQDIIVYVIGDPDIYENDNLSQALEDDYEYFSDNDYNYIHLNDTSEGLFDTELNEATLENIAEAFYETLTE